MAQVYSLVEGRSDSVRNICFRLIEDENWENETDNRIDVRNILLEDAVRRGSYSDVLRTTSELSTLYHESGDKVGEMRMKAESGFAILSLGDKVEGFARIDDAIHELETIESWPAFDAIIQALRKKAIYYKHAEDAVGVRMIAEQMLRRLYDYEGNPEDYAGGPENMGPETPEARSRYLDWELAQVYAFLSTGYSGLGDRWRGEHFANLFEETESSRNLSQRMLMLDAWQALRQYEKMDSTANALVKSWGRDTLTYNYALMLRTLSHASQDRGRLSESLSYMNRYQAVVDSLYKFQIRDEVAESAIRLMLNEKELARQDAENQIVRMRIVMLSGFLLVLLLLFLGVFYVRHRIVMSRKNEVLSRQISETLAYKDQILEMAADTHADDGPKDVDTDDESLKLFRKMSHVIMQDKLYLDRNLSRTSLTSRFNVSKEQISSAFVAGGTSLPAFVSDCRLEYACHLLKEHPELSIDDVSAQSGFTVRKSFSRSFKMKYALTPSEYREQYLNS